MTTHTTPAPIADPQPPPKVLFYPGKNMWCVEYYMLGQKVEKLFSNEDRYDIVMGKIKDFVESLKGKPSEAVA